MTTTWFVWMETEKKRTNDKCGLIAPLSFFGVAICRRLSNQWQQQPLNKKEKILELFFLGLLSLYFDDNLN